MTKTEVVFMACFWVLGLAALSTEWGGSAEMFLLASFLAGAMFEMLGENMPRPPYWNFVGRGALRTWGFVFVCILVIVFMGAAVNDRPAATDFVRQALGLGGLLPAFALAGIAFCLGLVGMAAEVPRRILQLVRNRWLDILCFVFVLTALYTIIRGVLFWPEPGRP